MAIRPYNEFSLIDRLTSRLNLPRKFVAQGPGDDCAVVRIGRLVRTWRAMSLLTTDLLIENIHFRRDWMTPEEIGFKAMRVNLSDIAAMGGIPRFALISLGLPPKARGAYAEKIFQGLRKAAEETGAAIVGGDTNASSKLVVNVALVGEAGPRVLLRSGARPGDVLYVTGTLGGSALGLEALKRGRRVGFERMIACHKKPPLRLDVGRALAKMKGVTALMDLSDGLAGDLPHLLKASGVGAAIDTRLLPLPRGFQRLAARFRLNPGHLAVSGGEDYELLFTASPRVKIPSKISGIPVSKLGKITPNAGRISDAGGILGSGGIKGFRHF